MPGRRMRARAQRAAVDAAVHITIEDRDDRAERMVRDPDRYFAGARRRAEQELMHQADWVVPPQRHPQQH